MTIRRSKGKHHQFGTACVGTSGWHYAHWRGNFYSDNLSAGEWLSFYGRHFSCVEINNTFYKFPESAVIDTWLATVPSNFVFALKASRYITHMKKLKEVEESTARFLQRAESFGDRLGPILFQLPPRWRVNLERLKSFLATLPEGYRYAMEFRDPSWHTESVYDLLRDFDVSLCQFHLAGFQTREVITTDLVYMRLHGPGDAYSGCYTETALEAWSMRIREWTGKGLIVFVFFDNDEAGYAVKNAADLEELMNVAETDRSIR